MTKTLHIKVPEELYYKLIELKGKLAATDWTDMMWKVVKHGNK